MVFNDSGEVNNVLFPKTADENCNGATGKPKEELDPKVVVLR